MRITLAVAVACLTFGGLAAAGDASAAIRKSTDIPAQGLGPALTKLAKEFDFQVLYRTEIVSNLKSQPAVGALTSDEALGKVLTGTGLTYKYLDDKTVTIVPASTAGSTPQNAAGSSDASTSKEAGKKSSQDFRVAQVDQGKSSSNVSVGEQGSTSQENSKSPSVGLEEIVVTAQKRSEKLMDVPASITAISGAQLESLHVDSLSDLEGYVPGLTVNSGGAPGYRVISIRGINDSYDPTTAPLVGVYIDNVPVNAASNSIYASLMGVDLNPYDLQDIEVLKGPQGTLYGSNAMGGIIKYVTRQPDLTRFEARAGTYTEYTKGTDSPNWGVRGAINLPLVSDKLAMRLSAFDQGTAGWIDNVGTAMSHVNGSREEGGRGALLWQVSDALAVRTTVLYQDTHNDSWSDIVLDRATWRPAFGWNKTDNHFGEPFSQMTRIGSLGIDWNFGFATLTSTSSWSKVDSTSQQDNSAYAVYFVPLPGALMKEDATVHLKKFSQEVRLASPDKQPFQWMIGGFYDTESGYQDAIWPSYTSAYQLLPVSDWLLVSIPGRNFAFDYKETAAFANLAYQITERFELGAGGRYTSYSEGGCGIEASAGVLAGAPPCTSLPSQGVSTWMADASFHVGDSMLYARVATGFRPGSGCPTCFNPFVPQAPPIVKSDTTTNYELGVKGEPLDRRMQYSLSAFVIDWTDIQVSTLAPNKAIYTSNAGAARSSGFEGSVAYELTKGLRVTATLAYTHAYLTVDDAGLGATRGDQLPTSVPWAASVAVDYTRPLRDDVSLNLGGSYRYKDALVNDFPGGGAGPLPLPPENIADVYTGLQLRQLALRLYGKNVFNNHSYAGVLFNPSPIYQEVAPVQPRTIGLSADYRF